MATPVQFSDVLRALEIGLWIRRNCFDSINNASTLYLGFKQDVLDLTQSLSHFQASFERAIPSLANDFSQASLLKHEADQFFGNFVATLADCKSLLKKHSKFQDERATALDNAWWHVDSQPIVTELRGRLQSHHYKLYLFVEPYKLDLLNGIQGDTREILALLRRQLGLEDTVRLPNLPQLANRAFADALVARDAPQHIDTLKQIPLAEGIDALSFHYRECTFQSDSMGIGPSQLSNFSLLKAHWLLETIKSSDGLKLSRPGSLFRRVLEQLGQGIELQYQKRKITQWPDDAFADLALSFFAIWPVKEVQKAPVLTDAAEREERLAEEELDCPFSAEKRVLFIFKVNDSLLRMVEARSRKDDSIGTQMTERFIHLDEDRFIPLYTVATSNGNKGTINLSHGKGAALASYEFKSRKSVLKVQRAFTGFETVSFSTGVWCHLTVKRKLRRDDCETGLGEIQIWQEPGALDLSSMPMSPSSTNNNSDRSINTSSGQTLASQTFSGFNSRIMSIKEREDGTEMVLSELPKAPLLVLFIKAKDHFSIWRTDLSCLELGKTRTVIGPQDKQLFQITLQVPTVKNFPVKRLSLPSNQLDLWDLHALSDRGGEKAKKGDKSMPMIEKVDATGIDLDFASKEARDRFISHFQVVSNARNDQLHIFKAGRKVAISSSHKPLRRTSQTSHITMIPQRESGLVGSESTIRGISPRLDEIPRLATLNLSTDVNITDATLEKHEERTRLPATKEAATFSSQMSSSSYDPMHPSKHDEMGSQIPPCLLESSRFSFSGQPLDVSAPLYPNRRGSDLLVALSNTAAGAWYKHQEAE